MAAEVAIADEHGNDEHAGCTDKIQHVLNPRLLFPESCFDLAKQTHPAQRFRMPKDGRARIPIQNRAVAEQNQGI